MLLRPVVLTRLSLSAAVACDARSNVTRNESAITIAAFEYRRTAPEAQILESAATIEVALVPRVFAGLTPT